jgi:hypothetical protein
MQQRVAERWAEWFWGGIMMWNQDTFETLIGLLPFELSVDWNKVPTPGKYGQLNALLAISVSMMRHEAQFLDPDGQPLKRLNISLIRRKLTDRQKKNFALVGHRTGYPMYFAQIRDLVYEVFFNYHFLVNTNTGRRQYFPSASVILRCRNFLEWKYVRSPCSWGPDIILILEDLRGTLVIETAFYGYLPRRLRSNFRGFKYVAAGSKYFITAVKPTRAEEQFLRNNGFEPILAPAEVDEVLALTDQLLEVYLSAQKARIKKG